MRRIAFASMVALAHGWLGACASPGLRSLEYLDETSAATIAAVGEPLVFARPRPEHAAHASDYVRLVAVDVNRAGKHDQWVLAYLHSTLDRRLVPATLTAAPEALFVRADDRDVRLVRAAHSAAEAGIARPVHAPKGARDAPVVYRVEADALAFIAGARHLTLRMDPGDDAPFEVWSDGRRSLAEFVRGR